MAGNSDKPLQNLGGSKGKELVHDSDKPLQKGDTKRTDLKNKEKKPCEVCGSDKMDQFIMTCSKCKETREHVYCSKEHRLSVPDNWICEQCSLRRSNRDRIPNRKYID